MSGNFRGLFLFPRRRYSKGVLSFVLIGLSLSMDAFAISLSSGISIPNLKPFYAIRAALFFGAFQFFMPVAGWYLGNTFVQVIQAWDHWIAFVLLAFVGGKMLLEAFREGGKEPEEGKGGAADIRRAGPLLVLALATSIDALAVGLSFSILGQEIWFPAALIGCITLGVCLIGFEFGRRIGLVLKRGAQIAGGLILTGIGVKILLEHLTGA
jgi:putative Mn2+ efflux pump MntP